MTGQRWLPEIELDWLPGYDGAQPVRIGNAAAGQPPLDAFGEVLTARLAARMAGLAGSRDPWDADELLDLLESAWREPDAGHLGDARPAAPVRALQGHGLGGRRRRGQDDRAVR